MLPSIYTVYTVLYRNVSPQYKTSRQSDDTMYQRPDATPHKATRATYRQLQLDGAQVPDPPLCPPIWHPARHSHSPLKRRPGHSAV